MQILTCQCLCVLAAIGQAVARPSYYSGHFADNTSIPFTRLMARQNDDFDVEDLSFIRNLAAIGDSYSAGIGAGDKLGNAGQALDKQSGMLTLPFYLVLWSLEANILLP
jgi:hypothetical protein